ncbi:MAG: hypothetical protein DYG89_36390 [Caldilinea sp. CFX5]|nr:hypothetical protein [Caldilinea sp. CFX5]
MGRIIRRTVTITITESWTIVWTEAGRAEDKPAPQTTTIVQEQPKPQEEADGTIQTTLIDGDPTAPPTPDGVSPKPGRQRKPTRRGRAAGKQSNT